MPSKGEGQSGAEGENPSSEDRAMIELAREILDAESCIMLTELAGLSEGKQLARIALAAAEWREYAASEMWLTMGTQTTLTNTQFRRMFDAILRGEGRGGEL